MDILDVCKKIEELARIHGINHVDDLTGNTVPEYSMTLPGLVTAFPDVEIWNVERTSYGGRISVNFGARKFYCLLCESEFKHINKIYGFVEDESSETV